MPSSLFNSLAINEAEMTEKEESKGFVGSMRKSFRQSTIKNSQRGRGGSDRGTGLN
jgi:hypothetical protein